MNETFPRPLVIGFLAFDRPIGSDGSLGPPLSTHARVTGPRVSVGTFVFETDENADKLRAWLQSDPGNRQKLNAWLDRNAANTSIAAFLNGSQFNLLRAKALQDLGVR